MPRGHKNINDHATPESRAKGRANAAEARRKKRELAEQIAEEIMRDEIRATVLRHMELRHDESGAVSMAAVREHYDRLFGKAIAPVELTGEDGGPMQIVVRSAFELDGDQPALLGDAETERPGEGVD